MAFDLSAAVAAGVCGSNTILQDNIGMPSVMVYIPKLTYAELGMGENDSVHPAFIVNGQEVPGIWVSKYQNVIREGRAYSLPCTVPTVGVDFDTAREACEAKGEGWHLMTRMEWGLLVRWCQHNGVMPKSNNNFGTSGSDAAIAIPGTKASGRTQLTQTGTGPLSWYHTQAADGICDMGGNTREWCGGIRVVYGEVQILPNNNAASLYYTQSASSTHWKAIRASTGELITPSGNGRTSGSLKMNCDSGTGDLQYSTTINGDTQDPIDQNKHYTSSNFGSLIVASSVGTETRLLLQSLGMLQYGDHQELFSAHNVYFNNVDPEVMMSGGGFYHDINGGFATFDTARERYYHDDHRGLRACFCQIPAAS